MCLYTTDKNVLSCRDLSSSNIKTLLNPPLCIYNDFIYQCSKLNANQISIKGELLNV